MIVIVSLNNHKNIYVSKNFSLLRLKKDPFEVITPLNLLQIVRHGVRDTAGRY